MGNSRNEFFIGPEVIDPKPEPHRYYRDRRGALKRQAARFRIYGLDAQDRPVAELTSANAKVKWTVHLANKKSAWYQFHIPLDIPEAATAPPSLLRNASIAKRGDLMIDPGPRSIRGNRQHGGRTRIFNTGRFMGKPVYLGELRTDEAGRLIVLGGRGVSESYAKPPSPVVGGENNETWHDDTSDGPVTAEVSYGGKPLKVVPGWVVVAPPNFAPRQKSVCTMWDLMRDIAIANPVPGFPSLEFPANPSFNDDIRPILERLSNLQWVNARYAAGFGWNGVSDFSTPEMLSRLSSTSDAYCALRKAIADQFRDPRALPAGDPYAAATGQLLPWQFGDVYSPAAPSPRQYASISPTQLRMLKENWVQGHFIDDYNPNTAPIRKIAQLPIAEQPGMLIRASLEFCVADAFHSGIEMSWNVRSPQCYMPGHPFRFLHAEAGWTEPNLGIAFTRGETVTVVGPLGPQVPGGVTRWLSVPWQADTGACKTVRKHPYDPYLTDWWPARVPNQVIAPWRYRRIMDSTLQLPKRLDAFAGRDDWNLPQNPLSGGGLPGEGGVLNGMVTRFADMGIIAERPGPMPKIRELPSTMQVSDRDPIPTVPSPPRPPIPRIPRRAGPREP